MEELKYSELVGSFTAGRATFEAIASAHIDTKPPEKPPWQRFMDLNVNVMQRIVGNPIVRWVGENLAWEIGKRFLGLKLRPAQAL